MAVVAAAMLTACSGNSEKTESGANSTAAESLTDNGEIDVVEDVIYNPDSTVTPAASTGIDPATATDAAAAAGQQAQGKAEQLYNDVKNGVEKGYDATKKGVKEGYDATKKGVKEGYDATKKGVKEGYDATKEKVTEWSGDVKDGVEKGVNAVKNL